MQELSNLELNTVTGGADSEGSWASKAWSGVKDFASKLGPQSVKPVGDNPFAPGQGADPFTHGIFGTARQPRS